MRRFGEVVVCFFLVRLRGPMERFVKRRERLRAALRSDDVDALLVSLSTNVSYSDRVQRRFVGADGRSRARPDHLGRSFHDAARAGMSGAGGTHSTAGPGDDPGDRRDVLEAMGLKRLAFEAACLTVADHLSLGRRVDRRQHGRRRRDGSRRCGRSRTTTRSRRFARRFGFAERAFAMLRAGLRTGESEKDVADALEGYSAALRRDRGELSADRGRGGPVGPAARAADARRPGSARTISC